MNFLSTPSEGTRAFLVLRLLFLLFTYKTPVHSEQQNKFLCLGDWVGGQCTHNSIDLLQESGTRTYPTQKQSSCGRNSPALQVRSTARWNETCTKNLFCWTLARGLMTRSPNDPIGSAVPCFALKCHGTILFGVFTLYV